MGHSKTGILQLVDGDGVFQEKSVAEFVKLHGLASAGVGYQVVAITGPQSSGKSTLMNAVFGTTFEEMDAMSGRHQTTKGIWLARSDKIGEPLTLVLDLEGSDGRERGEDDSSFERQSSLFALAIADVLLVNMWAKDVGREAGAGKPLLKTIFQVNLKLFQPAPKKRRTVLLFVFRDRTKTPLSRLKETWEEDLTSMWAAITKPPQYENYTFADFFEVQYASLPNFEEREEDFRADTVVLRRRFTEEDEHSLVRAGDDKLPGSSFALSLEKVWEVIRDQKDLNLPAHKVMVANIRCAEIMEDQLRHLTSDQAWTGLVQTASSQIVPGFGAQVAALVSSCLLGYDEEARYFEGGVRSAKKADLVASVNQLVGEAYAKQLGLLSAAVLADVKKAVAQGSATETFSELAARSKKAALDDFEERQKDLLVEGTSFTADKAKKQLADDIDSFIAVQKQKKVFEVVHSAQDSLSDAVTGPAIALLDSSPPDLWPRLTKLVVSGTERASEAVSEGLKGYDVDPKARAELDEQLRLFAREKVEVRVREAANTALSRMRDRFNEKFNKDENGLPRTWGPSVKIPAVTQAARLAAAQLLAQLAVLRLDGEQAGSDVVEGAIVGQAGDKTDGESAEGREGNEGFDLLAASEWPGITKERVLLSPAQCRTHWRQFASDSSVIVQQALSAQEAHKAASNRAPPLWVWLAIAFLGFNEMMAVLYNPLWLLLGIVVLLFGKTVYQELDVDAEMQRGLLPGVLAISAKFVPVVRNVALRTGESVQHLINNPHEVTDRIQQFQDQMAGTSSPARGTASDVNGDSNSSTISEITSPGLRDDSAVSSSASPASSGISGAVRQRKPHTGGHVETADFPSGESFENFTMAGN